MTASRIALASEISEGQQITEVDTPEGPFYRVVKVNAKSLVVTDDPADVADPLLVRVPRFGQCRVAV